jgi:putative SOS response-associated peptidase YedK
MCGRFTLRTPLTVLAKQFQFDLDAALRETGPRYNIAPTQTVTAKKDFCKKPTNAPFEIEQAEPWSNNAAASQIFPRPTGTTTSARGFEQAIRGDARLNLQAGFATGLFSPRANSIRVHTRNDRVAHSRHRSPLSQISRVSFSAARYSLRRFLDR